MSVNAPHYLVVLRRNGHPDVASPPHETPGFEDALYSELSRDGDIRTTFLDGSVEQFEVYPIGLGNQKSPKIYTQEDIIRNRDRWYGSEDSSESDPERET